MEAPSNQELQKTTLNKKLLLLKTTLYEEQSIPERRLTGYTTWKRLPPFFTKTNSEYFIIRQVIFMLQNRANVLFLQRQGEWTLIAARLGPLDHVSLATLTGFLEKFMLIGNEMLRLRKLPEIALFLNTSVCISALKHALIEEIARIDQALMRLEQSCLPMPPGSFNLTVSLQSLYFQLLQLCQNCKLITTLFWKLTKEHGDDTAQCVTIILDILYKELCLNTEKSGILKRLFEGVFKAYLYILESFLSLGYLEDSFKECFISKIEELDFKNDDFWQNGFILRPNIPAIFRSNAEIIIKLGKYRFLLAKFNLQGSKNHQFSSPTSLLNLDLNQVKNINNGDIGECVEAKSGKEGWGSYEDLDIFLFPSLKTMECGSILKSRGNLDEEEEKEEEEEPFEVIINQELTKYLEQQEETIKKALDALLNGQLFFTKRLDELGCYYFYQVPQNANFSDIPDFSLITISPSASKFEWPLNYILSASMMQKYQCISDFLGLIHGTKKFLQSAQLEMFKRARSLKQNPNRIKIAMGHKCLALVTLLDQYAQTAVIEPERQRLAGIVKSYDFHQIKLAWNEHLDRIIDQLLLNEKTSSLNAAIKRLLDLGVSMVNKQQQQQEEEEEEEEAMTVFKKEIRFISISVEIMARSSGTNYTINFLSGILKELRMAA